MNFADLKQMVIDYAIEYKCTIGTSIDDLEFDGPDGGSGGSMEDITRLLNEFGERVYMHVNKDPNNNGYCYWYTEAEMKKREEEDIAELLSL